MTSERETRAAGHGDARDRKQAQSGQAAHGNDSAPADILEALVVARTPENLSYMRGDAS